MSRLPVKQSRNVNYYVAGVVALLTLVIYLAALQNDFVMWDDNLYIYDNPHIRSVNTAFFQWAFLNFYEANWFPLTWLSHALDYAVWGLNPLGHHLTNIVLHAVNTFVVVLLVIRVLQVRKRPAPGGDATAFPAGRAILVAAGATGLLFGLHPVHVESVAWASERKDLLCALFFLLAVMMHLRYASARERQAGQKEIHSLAFRKYYLLSCGLFVLALLSKPMAVTLPVVLLVLDWYPLERIRSFRAFRQAVVEKIPFFALSLASSVITIRAQRWGGAIQSTEIIPLPARVLVGARSLVLYLWKMLWPLDLVPYYPYPEHPSVLSFGYLAAIALVIGITAVCIVLARRQKLWLAVWAYYGVTLVPVLGIVQVGYQAMADRYMYLPSIGPMLLLGLTAAWIWTKVERLHRRRLTAIASFAGVAVIVFAALSFLTLTQIGVWKNSMDLWSYVIRKEPHRVPVAYNNRGILYSKEGLYDDAIACFTESISASPRCYDCYYNRAVTFELIGHDDRALDDFTKALELNPNVADAYYHRGKLYLSMDRRESALTDFYKACNLGVEYACSALKQLTQESFLK